MIGTPHRQKPDIDNLWKAVTDTLWSEDSGIAFCYADKFWSLKGSIEVNVK
jgi:Holliday junction resolvase RusA-like endonuclease